MEIVKQLPFCHCYLCQYLSIRWWGHQPPRVLGPPGGRSRTLGGEELEVQEELPWSSNVWEWGVRTSHWKRSWWCCGRFRTRQPPRTISFQVDIWVSTAGPGRLAREMWQDRSRQPGRVPKVGRAAYRSTASVDANLDSYSLQFHIGILAHLTSDDEIGVFFYHLRNAKVSIGLHETIRTRWARIRRDWVDIST